MANQISVDVSSQTDFASFEQLVREYQPFAFSLAMRFLCDETEATDIVQESFLRVWLNRDRYDPEQKFSTWLYRIVTNLCLDRFRSLKRSRRLFVSRERESAFDDFPDQRDWQMELSNEQLAEIIKTLSADLSTKQRLVFTLRDLQDLTVEEVVEITGMSIGSVKSNLYYARKTIRDILLRRFGLVRGEL